MTDSDTTRIIEAIRAHSTYDFSNYSEKSFMRRVEKIMTDNLLAVDQLIFRIENSQEFLIHVVQEITVNTTELFRDVETWHAIKYRVLPKLKDKEEINIWHAGCSTGQEVYSMAMVLQELGLYEKANIFATDINTKVLDAAKRGVYQFRFNQEYLKNFDKVMRYNPYNYEEFIDVPDSKYLAIDKAADTLSVHNFLKERVVFQQHNLVTGQKPKDIDFDLILCRNVLIYFNYQLQNRIFDYFYDSLVTKGFLILGKHESMLGAIVSKYNKRGTFYTKKNMV